MDVWVLDGVEYQEQLLQYVLSKEKCRNTIVVAVVDLLQPWEVMDSLERWTEVVRTHLNSLNIPPKDFSEMRDAGKQNNSVGKYLGLLVCAKGHIVTHNITGELISTMDYC